METVQYLPKGILLYAHDYQLNVSSPKRGVPVMDSLLPPAKRIKTGIGKGSTQEHHYQELPWDVSDVQSPVVDVNSQTKHKADHDGGSQQQQNSESSEQPIAQQHQPQQAGERAEAHFQDLEKQPDAGCSDCHAVKSQLEQAEREIKQLQRQRFSQRKPARDESAVRMSYFKRGLKAGEAKRQDVQSRLDEATKTIEAQRQQLKQQQSAGETAEKQRQEASKQAITKYNQKVGEYEQKIRELQGELKKRNDTMTETWKVAAGEHQRQMNDIQTLRETLKGGEQAVIEHWNTASNQHESIVTGKNREIEKLRGQIRAAEETKRQDDLAIAKLQNDLRWEEERWNILDGQYNNLHEQFSKGIERLHDARTESEGQKAREIRDLTMKCNNLDKENEDWKESHGQMEGAFDDAKKDRDAAKAKLTRVNAVISKRQYDRVVSGNGNRRKPKKEARSVKNASKAGHSNSLVLGHQSITKNRKRPANSVTQAMLRKPAVSQDLYKLVNASKSNNFDELVHCTKTFGLKGKDKSGTEVDETEEYEQEDEDLDDEEAEEEDESRRFEEDLESALADPENDEPDNTDEVEEDSAMGEVQPEDEHLDNDPNASVPHNKADDGNQSDDDLSEHDDEEFPLEVVGNATANSFY